MTLIRRVPSFATSTRTRERTSQNLTLEMLCIWRRNKLMICSQVLSSPPNLPCKIRQHIYRQYQHKERLSAQYIEQKLTNTKECRSSEQSPQRTAFSFFGCYLNDYVVFHLLITPDIAFPKQSVLERHVSSTYIINIRIHP